MRRTALVAALVLAAAPLSAQAPAPLRVQPADRQIAAAVLPLPEDVRAGAAVLGYDPQGRLVRLREGTNHFVCLADDPRDDRFHVACYHDALEPFMARGRELRAQGVQGDTVDSVRFADVAAGRIRVPPVARLYSMTGPATGYDPATGAVTGARRLSVVYVPFATEASTGLSTPPRTGAPWLMHPGTAKAHIMFTPEM